MHISIRRGKDKDGNHWGVGLVFDEERRRGQRWRVAIHANGCWLTAAQTGRVFHAINVALIECDKRNRNDRRKP